MNTRLVAYSIILIATYGVIAAAGTNDEAPSLTAPTYYIAGKVDRCNGESLRVWGASNLPPDSLLAIRVGEVYGDFAFLAYSEAIQAKLNSQGYFDVVVHAKQGTRFRPRLVASISFGPPYDKQPAVVRRTIGSKGEKLDTTPNPQVNYLSGENRALGEDVVLGFCGTN